MDLKSLGKLSTVDPCDRSLHLPEAVPPKESMASRTVISLCTGIDLFVYSLSQKHA